MGEKERALLERAPGLRRRDIEEINGLFKAYVFRRSSTGEIWTTCCRKHEILPPDHEIWAERHQPEQRYRYWHGYKVIDPPENTACPFCGAETQVKDLKYSGRRKNLWEEQRIVLLRVVRGVLWAEAAWCVKDYGGDLTAPPKARGGAVYRFGTDRMTWVPAHWYYGYRNLHTVRYEDVTLAALDRPFQWMAEKGYGYHVVGWDALDKTPVRYAGGREYAEKNEGDLIRWLALAYAYPRQVEMLHKMGMDDVIYDRAERGVKNARLFRWDETDPRKSFGLTKEELREVLAIQKPTELMKEHKALLRRGIRTDFSTLAALRDMSYSWQDLLKICKERGLRPSRLRRYLEWTGSKTRVQTWLDYVCMAGKLGWDLNDETVLLPKNLRRKHNEAVAENNARIARQRAAQEAVEKKTYEKSLKRRHKVYDFAKNGFLIRVAASAEEIIDEGKTLRHCVGGYAERHLAGKTTILFLRREAEPEKSLYTIEMDGAILRQIHGYRNEWDGAPDPRGTMAWLLEPWLAWIAAGSHRKKDGTPILPETEAAG